MNHHCNEDADEQQQQPAWRCNLCATALCGTACFQQHLTIGCGFYLPNMEDKTVENEAFLKVLMTTPTQQLTVMHLKPGEDIGPEVHPNTTQSVRVEKGAGWASVDRGLYKLSKESWVTIPPGNEHNIWADEDGAGIWLYSIYSPPKHPAGAVYQRKADMPAE